MTFWDGTRWVSETSVRSSEFRGGRRLFGAVAEAGLITLLIFGLIAGTALAAPGANGKGNGGGKPGGGASGSLATVMVIDANANGGPDWNDQVTFEVTTTATDKPWVRLDCYQAGMWVSTATAGFFAAYPWEPNFTLASGAWTSGGGDCTATLYMVSSNGKNRSLATLAFAVGP